MKRVVLFTLIAVVLCIGTAGAVTAEANNESAVDPAFDYDPGSPVVNQTITFDANASSADNDIDEYEWQFDDGTGPVTTQNETITHNYTAAGSYNVTLTVRDTAGNEDTVNKTVVVEKPLFNVTGIDPEPLSIEEGEEFTVGANVTNEAAEAGTQNLTFTANGTQYAVTSVRLGAGEQAFVQFENVTVDLAPGDYGFTIASETDSAPGQMTVEESTSGSNVSAEFDFGPSNPEAGETVVFDASNSSADNGISEYRWAFGDGTNVTTNDSTVQHTFETEGDYNTELTVVDNNGSQDSTAKTVPVAAPTDLEVGVVTDSTSTSFTSNATVKLHVGAFDRATEPRSPVANQNLTIQIDRPDGERETFNVTTGSDGSHVFEYDIAAEKNRTVGSYSVSVQDAAGTDTDYEYFDVGPTSTETTRTYTPALVGDETNVSVLVRNGTDAATGEEYNVTVRGPNGELFNETATVDADGFISTSFTPQTEGRYSVDGEAVDTGDSFYQSVRAANFTGDIRTSTYGLNANETVPYGGILYGADGPANGTDLVINVTNGTHVIDTFETQTDSFGFFLINWNAPANPDESYRIEARTANGSSVQLSDTYLSTDEDPFAPQVVVDDNYIPAGEPTEIRAEFRVDGERTAGQELVLEGPINENDSTLNATTDNVGEARFVVNATESGEVVINATNRDTQVTINVYDSGSSDNVRFYASREQYHPVAPGENVTYRLEAFKDGDPLAGETVDVYLGYGYGGPPAATATVTLDQNGKANYTFEVPENAPDGADIDGEAVLKLDNGTASSSIYGPDIQAYEVAYDTSNVTTAGETSTITVQATRPGSDTAVEGIPVFLDAQYAGQRIGTFQTASAVTDGNGTAEIDLAVPGDATAVRLNFEGKYYEQGSRFTRVVKAGDVHLTADTAVAAPTETVNVSFETNTSTEVRGIIQSSSRYDNGDIQASVVGAGENATVTVPVYARNGDDYGTDVFAIDKDGRLYQASEYRTFEVQEEFDLNQIKIQHDRTLGGAYSSGDWHTEAILVQSVEHRTFEVGGDTGTGIRIRDTESGAALTAVINTSDPVTVNGLDLRQVYEPNGSIEDPKVQLHGPNYKEADIDIVNADSGIFNRTVFSTYEVELVANATSTQPEVVDTTEPRLVGIGYQGQLQQNSTQGTIELTFPRDAEVNESWDVTFRIGSSYDPVLEKNLENNASDEQFSFTINASELEEDEYHFSQITFEPQEPQFGEDDIANRILTTLVSVTVNRSAGVDAAFDVATEDPKVNESVTFDASGSTAAEGDIEEYVWEFGDGTTLTTNNSTVNHTYEKAGDYQVNLTVTDSNGSSDTVSRLVTVRDLITVSGQFVLYNGSVGSYDNVGVFTNDGLRNTQADANGNFSLQLPAREEPYTLIYTQGNATVGEDISNMFPRDDNVDTHVEQIPGNTSTDLGAYNLPRGHPVNVTVVDEGGDPVDGAFVTYLDREEETNARGGWIFPNATVDGIPTGPNGTKFPGIEMNGSTEIVVTPPANDSRFVDRDVRLNLTANKSHDIEIVLDEVPPAAFDVEPDSPAVNETVTFNASNSTAAGDDIEAYVWDFGDGTTLTTNNSTVTHTYNESGEYNVTLTVRDANGTENTTTTTIRVGGASVSDYANENDVVDTEGLRTAVGDWRTGDIDTQLLRDVISAWRSGEKVN